MTKIRQFFFTLYKKFSNLFKKVQNSIPKKARIYSAVSANATSTLDIKFNPSGTHVTKDGSLKIRLDFYPRIGDKSYPSQHVYVPIIPASGYPGKVGKDGNPVDLKEYQDWLASLPHEWKLNPVLCHFITVPSYVTANDVLAFIRDKFHADVTTTIDDIMVQDNSMHLISPYLRDKSILAKQSVAKSAEGIVISQVNQRLAGLLVKAGTDLGSNVEVKPESIDVGDAVSNRTTGVYIHSATAFSIANPANATGTLDTVKIWMITDTTVKAGTVYNSSGDNYTCRDVETLGAITSGSEQTVTGLTITVETGDLLAVKADASPLAQIEATSSATRNVYTCSGDKLSVSTDATYTSQAIIGMSVYATGTDVTVPTVTTAAATSVTDTTATVNGEITATGGADCDARGFVYGTTTQAAPGNVAPASSGYDDDATESGTFGTGVFDEDLTSLTDDTTYYVRAYAHNSAGYAYGDEVEFTTEETVVPSAAGATVIYGNKYGVIISGGDDEPIQIG